MQVLTLGVDPNTIKHLEAQSICSATRDEISRLEDVVSWLRDDCCEVVLVNTASVSWGFEIPKALRREGIKKPIVALAKSTDDWSDLCAAFLESGGDDIMHISASHREIAARLRACSRRSHGLFEDTITFSKDGVSIALDRATQTVLVNSSVLSFTPIEYKLFEALMVGGRRLQARADLINRVYTHGQNVDERTIDVHIGRIRLKLSSAGTRASSFLKTVHGFGYRIGI